MKTIANKTGWIVAGVLAIIAISLAAREVAGGALDPPGAPTSTMQTLDNIPPAWDRQLISTDGLGSGCESSRFKCVMLRVVCQPDCIFVYDGVLDLETGLVWKRDAGAAVSFFPYWDFVLDGCLKYRGGERGGWRLPTAAELMSLLGNTSLPASHPFLNVTAYDGAFWTSSPAPGGSGAYYVVNFTGGVLTTQQPGGDAGAWCVRGAVTQ